MRQRNIILPAGIMSAQTVELNDWQDAVGSSDDAGMTITDGGEVVDCVVADGSKENT